MRACQLAKADPGQPYVLIIDEINRANLSKVFGELLMLVESDKRDKKFALELAYSTEADERFYIPENLHIIGLMNTADRSLALVDYALRRRFKFFDLTPGFETPEFRSYLLGRGVPEPVIDHLRVTLGQLNKAIAQDRDLGSGFLIGHSYFCDLPAEEDAEDAYNEIVEHEIVPLLREYWYEGYVTHWWLKPFGMLIWHRGGCGGSFPVVATRPLADFFHNIYFPNPGGMPGLGGLGFEPVGGGRWRSAIARRRR